MRIHLAGGGVYQATQIVDRGILSPKESVRQTCDKNGKGSVVDGATTRSTIVKKLTFIRLDKLVVGIMFIESIIEKQAKAIARKREFW